MRNPLLINAAEIAIKLLYSRQIPSKQCLVRESRIGLQEIHIHC